MKPVKISEGYLDELKEHGETPNKAIGNLLGNPQGNLNNKEVNPEQSQSVADLKIKLNPILKSIYNKLDILKKQQETIKEEMSKEFNLRVNKVISHSLNCALEGLKRQILQELKIREVTERSEGQH